MRAEEEMISWDKLKPILVEIKEAATMPIRKKFISYLINLYHNLIHNLMALIINKR